VRLPATSLTLTHASAAIAIAWTPPVEKATSATATKVSKVILTFQDSEDIGCKVIYTVTTIFYF
jgi:hypothetical protein